MTTIDQIIQHAELHCKNNGSRLTQKRINVLKGLLQSEKALSAYELVDYCSKKLDQPLPAMSVYRILDFLQQEQLVHKLNLANKYVACSHITCNHAHEVPQFLICSDCQRVTEISIDKEIIQNLQANVEEARYRLNSPQLEMNCVCENCTKDAA